jgi:DNA-binding MarR family transcriptional regulator
VRAVAAVQRGGGARAVAGEERRRFYTALQRLLRIYQFRDRDVACYGDVSADECYALEAIEAGGPLRVGDLAAALNLHKSNASRLAAALEAKGYVARAAERGDGRAVRLRVTARGRAVHGAIQGRVEAIHAEILARYPAATRQAFVRLLGELADEARERVGGAGRGGCAPESDVSRRPVR